MVKRIASEDHRRDCATHKITTNQGREPHDSTPNTMVQHVVTLRRNSVSQKMFLHASQYASATDRSPPLPPPKSRAWRFKRDGMPRWPTDFGGTAVYWRSDRGDGDAKAFKQIPFAQKNDKQSRE